jgi:hypothetical protein
MRREDLKLDVAWCSLYFACLHHCEVFVDRPAIYKSFVPTVLWSDSQNVSQLLQKYDGRPGRGFHGTAIRLRLFAFMGKKDR